MPRIDRLFSLLLAIQRYGPISVPALAERLEVSTRTVYRDIALLLSAGNVPLIAEKGRGYSLMEGYFLPPLALTNEEALALLLGSAVLAEQFESALLAQEKIETILPPRVLQEVHEAQRTIRVHTHTEGTSLLKDLRHALREKRQVRFQYTTRSAAHTTVRTVDPYRLISCSGVWYLHGYCHLRAAPRDFRLGRIASLSVLETTFLSDDTLSADEEKESGRDCLVRVVLNPSARQRLYEQPNHYVVSQEETAAGILLTLLVRHEDELLGWLLSWGSGVRILEPDSLRERVQHEAQKIIACLQENTQ